MDMTIVIRILVLVFSIVVHEVAHGWAALKLGDDTAHRMGRLTLNPIPHIDPVGSIIVPIFMSLGGIPFGWAKPVPVHVGRLNNPNDDHPKVAAAGPASNLLLAFFFSVLFGISAKVGLISGHATGNDLGSFLQTLFEAGILVNVVLAVFNLIPLPPLDGSWIVSRFLPPEPRANYENLRRHGMLIILGFILLLNFTPVGDYFGRIIWSVFGWYWNIVNFIASL